MTKTQTELNFGNNGRALELPFPESPTVNLEENWRLKNELKQVLSDTERELVKSELLRNKERKVAI